MICLTTALYLMFREHILSPARCRSMVVSATSNQIYTDFYKEFSTSTEQHIWIDQLSINQDDVSERSQQVSIMSMISSQASKVLDWLDFEPCPIEDLGSREPHDPPNPNIGIAMKILEDETRRTKITNIWDSRFESSSRLKTLQAPAEALIPNLCDHRSLYLFLLASEQLPVSSVGR